MGQRKSSPFAIRFFVSYLSHSRVRQVIHGRPAGRLLRPRRWPAVDNLLDQMFCDPPYQARTVVRSGCLKSGHLTGPTSIRAGTRPGTTYRMRKALESPHYGRAPSRTTVTCEGNPLTVRARQTFKRCCRSTLAVQVAAIFFAGGLMVAPGGISPNSR